MQPNQEELLIQKLIERYRPKVESKTGIKNNRTIQKLEGSLVNELTAFIKKNNDREKDDDYYEALEKALDRAAFFYTNEPLLYKLVRSFDNTELPEADRVSAAQYGFLTALDNYDPSRGAAFSTYAWRLMSNEVIAALKRYKKENVIQLPSRERIAPYDCVVTRIKESVGGRIIKEKNQTQQLYDVYVDGDGESDVYQYTFNVQVKEGDRLKKGDSIGWRAGAERSVFSFEGVLEDPNVVDVRATSLLKKTDPSYDKLDNRVLRNTIMGVINDLKKELSPVENGILEGRFLYDGNKATTKLELSKRFGVTINQLNKSEAELLRKLKKTLTDHQFSISDVNAFKKY